MIKTIEKHGVRRVSNEIIGPIQMNLFNIGQYGWTFGNRRVMEWMN